MNLFQLLPSFAFRCESKTFEEVAYGIIIRKTSDERNICNRLALPLFTMYMHGNGGHTVIRTHNHNGAFSFINLMCVVCMAMTGVVAFTVYKCLEQIYQTQALEPSSSRIYMV